MDITRGRAIGMPLFNTATQGVVGVFRREMADVDIVHITVARGLQNSEGTVSPKVMRFA